jgi:hypothetical protein
LLTGTSQAIGKHLRDRTVRAGVAPEFMPNRNSELIGSRYRSADDAARLETGELRDSIASGGSPALAVALVYPGFHTGNWRMRNGPRSLRLNGCPKGPACAPHTTRPRHEPQMNTTPIASTAPKSAVASSNGSRVAMRAALITSIGEES